MMDFTTFLRPEAALKPRRLLYVGAGRIACEDHARGDLLHVMPLPRLTAGTLNAIQPDMVILPLIGAVDDAIAVLEVLARLDYRGICLVLCPPLPKPQAVAAELRSLCPGLHVQLHICLPG